MSAPFGSQDVLIPAEREVSTATAQVDSSFFLIPGEVLREAPIVRWKLTETFRKRLFWFRNHAKLEWTKDYGLGGETGRYQRRLFKVVRDLADCLEWPGKPRACAELQSEAEKEGSELFSAQETLMKRRQFPGIERHREEHERMLAQIRRLDDRKTLLEETNHESVRDFLKDWVLTHTIIEDRKLKAFLARKK